MNKCHGDVTIVFREYSAKLNKETVKTSFEKLTPRMFVPAMIVDLYASFPKKYSCK